MSTVTPVQKTSTALTSRPVTEEYMQSLSGIIQEVAVALRVTEPQAVSITGTALKLTNMALSITEIVQMVNTAKRRHESEVSAGEEQLLFAGGWIQRIKPFEGSAGTVSRNAPCPCKSGKKYKHCCIGIAKEHDRLRYVNGK